MIEATRAVNVEPTPAARRQPSLGGRFAYMMTAGLVVVAAAAGVLTFALPDVLTGPAVMNGSARGTALVVVVVALPVLAVSAWAASRGSVRAIFGWLGAAGYLLYNAIMFIFATPFNELFLLYVAMLSLSLWSIVAVLAGTNVQDLADRVLPHLPVRPVAVYTWTVAGLNALAWLGTIGPATFSSEPSAVLDGTGMTTNPVYVQDLGIWLPLIAVAAFWLWRRQPWGVLVVGSGLTLWVIESIGIAVDQWFGSTADPTSSVASASVVPVFAALAVVGLVPLYFFYRPRLSRSPGR